MTVRRVTVSLRLEYLVVLVLFLWSEMMRRVLSLGAGWQSTTLLLMSLKGILPKLDAWIFADTHWEPKAVYRHLEWLKELSRAVGLPFYEVTAGDLRQDAIDFRRLRRTSDTPGRVGPKRYASIPVFVKNLDGSQGKVKRQCTKEYKIEPVERCIKREILGLKPRQRAPLFPVVEHWFGISMDEAQRAVFPGRYKQKVMHTQRLLFEADGQVMKRKEWVPKRWSIHAYPLLDVAMMSNRTSNPLGYLPHTMTRKDVGEWLKTNYPDREIPRSACIGCPFHDNAEWKRMRDESPEEWADAVQFDKDQRVADRDGPGRRGLLVGEPYVHRQLVPLDMVNLDGDGEKSGMGCGMLGDGLDGMCDT